MINEVFYNPVNLVKEYLGGGIPHYVARDRSVVTEVYQYRVKAHETIYSIAKMIFGDNLQHYWTYILECNPIRHPDDIREGDIINIPKIIIRDSSTNQFLNKL